MGVLTYSSFPTVTALEEMARHSRSRIMVWVGRLVRLLMPDCKGSGEVALSLSRAEGRGSCIHIAI